MALYHSRDSKDNCGFGLIAHMQGDASHKVIRTAVHALNRLQHRGGIAADGKTGDGCGLLLQKPDSFFRTIAEEKGWNLGRKYAVGMFFFNPDKEKQEHARQIIEEELQKETLTIIGWRLVPINSDILGEIAKSSLPVIEQLFVNAQPGWRKKDLERRLYIARRRIEKRITNDPVFYIPSLSCLVTVYKALTLAEDFANFYKDLSDIRMESAIALFHQRFSTNTLPQWSLAQPFRYLAHNGEINTITGNRAWARARTYKFASPLLPDLADAAPYVNEDGSDSSALDNMLELFLAGGMDLFRAMRLLVPPAWENNHIMDAEVRAFYEFNSMHMEPWDGPAGIVMTNGRHASCNLDRNGLRPARYVITKDNLITIASEVGIWDYSPDEVESKGRIAPGEMLAVDTYTGKLWSSRDIDDDLKSRLPYRDWLNENTRRLIPFHKMKTPAIGQPLFSDELMLVFHKLFQYSTEEIVQSIVVLGENGQEAVGSMGDDTPMAAFSLKPRAIYDYFRQLFAQVTNPAIDPLREKHVMSLGICIGREQNVFNETSGYADRVLLDSPVLTYSDLKQLKEFDEKHYAAVTFSLNYNEDISLQQAIENLTQSVVRSVQQFHTVIIILSDRDIHPNKRPIPAPFAVGAVQKALSEHNLRCDTNIVIETASCRNPHHCAVLLGLGATAVYPYLAYETLEQLVREKKLSHSAKACITNFRNGLNKGILKIMSKMGISTIASYRCSQLFEVVGIHQHIVELCFPGLKSRIQGHDFTDFQQQLDRASRFAWNPRKAISHGGLLKYVHGGEEHAYHPGIVQSLQKFVHSNDIKDYLSFSTMVHDRPISHIRDCFHLKSNISEIPIDEVEPENSFYPRFDTAAMSIGALSPEAHEALAIAMNTLGGQSNSGEGGEDPARFNSLKNSKIKQVASGRFGVTAYYLMHAEVIQIKVAQGAKPGEGGQLPGDKATPEIARLRFSVPGVTLISPPPHHDIYSIEDLAQLIFDLKQLNPNALISVKLVSEPGIGTIAAGVAKAHADLITVSGYDGGTGASPLTSVKYAGSPWELGLAEVHHALVDNGLRHKVKVQVDGGLKTGLDVVKAAILGAESFGFGTGPMVALGCKYLRICHLNNCATGVATQDKTLRDKHFHGLPEMVIRYFQALAHEVREIMASLGIAKLTDLIGRVDLLEPDQALSHHLKNFNFEPMLLSSSVQSSNALFHCAPNVPRDLGALNQKMLQDCLPALQSQSGGIFRYTIRNTDRSIGATLSGAIAKQFGQSGLNQHPVHIHFTGTAGQCFGVWNVPGLNLHLTGDCNDYVGKGMSGGKLSIHPPKGVSFQTNASAIIGNTCLYGATGGSLFAAGCAGERFAVRNSGATAVVEGVGDNACEYMTGGTVVILGEVGNNFGAGMTGGMVFIFDPLDQLGDKLNTELVDMHVLNQGALAEHLQQLIQQHITETESDYASHLLTNFLKNLSHFRLVKPKGVEMSALLQHPDAAHDKIQVRLV
ncbi:glutamate synthase large subunit [Algicola sagamiensis]|uniref:glutamate synthase large subunit n=1 Tax=Algicola sagamiensis TaxID=163869 RepID=UPI00037D3F69|nr:glutamate synthase large subunit [Algicola sagamiensis]